ncbi:MAG: HAMP domain-containing histidine kinase [Acidimicrobiia bacterium]|nr:HAMP domain-containing histidine kinase [Acidimicrobiia bacterium]MBT8216839.1 HAMP domain-containing histidine kinase [Acidimicrobiia bacterium]NNF11147.1 HAMP domain-containing histidine kinase [Acidimicrobiia bacterium]NNL69349.1 HAMP domain-containing histidine kinase [Acidimicrobiia bacterium]
MEHAPQAPPAYDDIGPAFDRTRTVNLLLAAVAIFAIGFEVGWEAFALAFVTLIVGGGSNEYRRRRPGRSTLVAVAIDVSMIGAVLFMTGTWPTLLLAATPYMLVMAFLLLPPGKALIIVVYMGTLVTGAHYFAPGWISEATNSLYVNVVTAVLFLVLTVIAVASASGSLHKIRGVERRMLDSARQANLAKDQFVSMVSHELRTPLTSISGFAETLRAGWEEFEEQEIHEFLEIITTQADHLHELVEDILILPRLEAGKLTIHPEVFDPAPLTHRIVSLLFPIGGPAEARVAIAGGTQIFADPRRVEQVLRNLLGNARKYGGDEVLVDGQEHEDAFVITVTDNGQGVPAEDHERIFDHFEQVSKGDDRTDTGVGLGLPIARRLVRAMGGDLTYSDAFPHGARFSFTLPLADVTQLTQRSA